ncbi:MAG TPA: hypothetical protein VGD90_07120 [Sphingobacteriaceae bacterium]
MEPTFSTGQVVFYLNPSTNQYLPAIIKAISQIDDRIDYLLEVQAGTGHEMRSEETIASQDGILTFHEFIQTLGRGEVQRG